MESTLSLIDKAAEVCGGQNALAERLGFSKGTMSDMKHGRKAISPATAAELADIAGVDVDYAIKLAVLESVKGTRREFKMREILGKALCAGGAAMLLTSCSAEWKDSSQSTVSNGYKSKHPTYRIYQNLRRIMARFQPQKNRFFMA